MKHLIIGSRGSELALWQANYVKDLLSSFGLSTEIRVIKTKGDNIQDIGFDKLEGKGFFTKEIEDALLNNEIDIAVHSNKDLPTAMPPGLLIAAVSGREDPSELILINKNALDESRKFSLKKNATIGTSSPRRKSQLLAVRDDLTIKDLRGNVPTRIRKLHEGNYDAIMLAAAGVERLGLDISDLNPIKISPKEFIPAPAQGVLAIQIRETDKELFQELQKIHRADVAETIAVERKVLNLMEGGCQLPLGVYCEKETTDESVVFKVWTSMSSKWEIPPLYFYTESKNPEGLPAKIVEKLKNSKPCSVFISRDPRKNDLFSRVLTSNGYTVHSKALVEIKKVPIGNMPKTEWVFFSSKNAVKYFFEQNPVMSGAKYGAVGKSTAESLRKFGVKADFIGYSTDTKLTGKQFASTVGGNTVLFPQAKESMRTIQKQFTNQKLVFDLPVYETLKFKDFKMPSADILIFTSPSNVEAFFEENKISSGQKVVAMGDATAATLREHGIRANSMPVSFDDQGLIQAITAIS